MTSKEAIDRYILLESQLERATSRLMEEKLVHELGKLEIIDGVTSDKVRERKAQIKRGEE